MKLSALVLVAATLSVVLGAQRSIGAENQPGPRLAPGLWVQMTKLTGTHADPQNPPEPRFSAQCVGESGAYIFPYYDQKAGRTCSVDVQSRGEDGVWSSRTVCENDEVGTATVTGEVTGDLLDRFKVSGRVERAGSFTDADVRGLRFGPCPGDMAPGTAGTLPPGLITSELFE